MAVTTIRRAVRRALENLPVKDFQTFCQELRDRREEPRVLCSHTENKSRGEIADLLVSTFTEPKARDVTLEVLRLINCNEEAENLDSKTKACVDKGDPTFRKTSTGELETKPSPEALTHRGPLQAAGHGGPPGSVKKPEEVEAEAKARVLSEGGDAGNARLVLSRCTIQFGKYKGQSFKWLLENDVGYTAFLVAGEQKPRQDTTCPSPLTVNKDSLTRYVTAYPEVLEEVRFHRAYERSRLSGKKGQFLIGFGPYRWDTLQDLYESKDRDKSRYVNGLRTMKKTCDPGSKMDVAVRYILQRDTRAGRKRTIGAQSTRRQSTSASRPTERKQRRTTSLPLPR